MNATEITVIGNVVNSPSRNRTQNGSVTNFRMAATERRFDSGTQDWIDGHSFFVDVECWGELGGNVSHSISKGDPVVVVGNIRTHEWESEQGRRSRPQIRAEAVAPNLARGTAEFKKTQRSSVAAQEAPESASDAPSVEELAEILGGREYDGAVGALQEEDAADLDPEPTHA
ncbi:single-stranded DNA-binding protein [Blastococcus sp. PRF04-17]|uniref:single-stranded DNA-binding protein n=1 Tax=Blastococcus sp. PRF04-17 TaxID=2933797 RepID=UPI001FF347F1|nr:single-stranded DNA-binding protein [Blastococcus sp. PRF04-17]UOY03406.1 single-stranded DNA-binding protein [Blastococcus sp. PRF04-17]